MGPREGVLGSAGGYRKVSTVVVAVYRNAQELPERLHVVKPDVLKTSPQRCVRSLCSLGRRTGGFGNGVGMDGTGELWMLIPFSLALLRSAMSSKLPSVLSATDEEIQLLLSAQSHIGSKNCDKQMLSYVWKRRSDG